MRRVEIDSLIDSDRWIRAEGQRETEPTPYKSDFPPAADRE